MDEVTLKLYELIGIKHLCLRDNAKRVYQEKVWPIIKGQWNAKIVLDFEKIESSTGSYIDQLLLIDMYAYCIKYDSIMMIRNVGAELLDDIRMAVSLASEMSSEDICRNTCVLYDKGNGEIDIIGFGKSEEQYNLFQFIKDSVAPVTSRELEIQKKIKKTAAANRLARLYEKRIVFRKPLGQLELIGQKGYAYYF